MRKRVREREVVAAALSALSTTWGVDVRGIAYPEDQRPAPQQPLDAVADTTAGPVVVEHTTYMSFPNEIQDGHRVVQQLGPMVRQLSGTLPRPGNFQLSVPIGALDGHPVVDTDALAAWIMKHAPDLGVGKTTGGPSHYISGEPPATPVPVRLYRFPGSGDGGLSLTRPINPDTLPTETLGQARTAVAKKLPKLARHRPDHGKSLLVLEAPDIQLVNAFNAATAVRTAIEEDETLVAPDAVILVNTLARPWSIQWLKDGDAWLPDLDRPVSHHE